MESEATTSSRVELRVEPEQDGYNEYAPRNKRKKNLSKVWLEYNEEVNDNGVGVANCRHCKINLVCGSSKGTSHLKRHLLQYSPKRPNGPIGEVLINDNNDIREFVFDMKERRVEILNCIVEGAHLFSTVEENGFKRRMTRANPQFESFCRTTITIDFFSEYYCYREKLQCMLVNTPGLISLTTDLSDSKHSWQHYMCITAHFIDKNWKLPKTIP